MIIVKTPLRISFIGGGSDIPAFYKQFPGATISTTINKYIYICINKKFDNRIRASYSVTEIVNHVNQLKHTRIKECMKYTGVDKGIEIVTIADVPSKGTGLGSSSSLTVGLLKAMYAYKGQTISEEELADQACQIEINKLHEPIGKQDQYIAGYGGFRFIEYLPNDKVTVNYVICKPETLEKIQNSIMLFYTGITRSTNDILHHQIKGYSQNHKLENAKKMVSLAYELKKQVEKNNVNNFGQLLHEAWILKKTLAYNISQPKIDEMYEIARKNGALGGKLLGAGGGGFLMVFAPLKKQEKIRRALRRYYEMKISFEPEGCKILFMKKI